MQHKKLVNRFPLTINTNKMSNKNKQFHNDKVVIELTLDSWGMYRNDSEKPNLISDVFSTENIAFVGDDFTTVINSMVEKLNLHLSEDNLSSNIKVNRVIPMKILDSVMLILSELDVTDEYDICISKDNYDELSDSTQEYLSELIFFNIIDDSPGKAEQLYNYLKIRSESQNHKFLNDECSLRDLYYEGERNFYGVIVDDECIPIKDTCEPLQGFFKWVMSSIMDIGISRKSAA